MDENLIKDALKYHTDPRPGKVDVLSSKACRTERDLSLAYSPGVAAPCLEIAKNPEAAYDYTTKGNLVAVITNGTAVLGLGDIGPLAGKPVMEGKGVLFKLFADINVFDIEINAKDPELFIQTVKALEPTFGGINLEDIKAPECFYIEKRLKEEMKIPVFHDDQHGTAIISGAALLNSLQITGKKITEIKVVVNGAGAAAITCGKIFRALGVPQQNIFMCDSKGVIYHGRKDGMNEYKMEFAQNTKERSLADAVKGSDVFMGLSVAGAFTKDMLKTMNKNPIVFAMANPEPEILPPDAKSVRDDVIIATGRSDFPNQVNNVLGFPYIFRGALDVRATTITENMKLAAVHALAALAREDVPDSVMAAYRGTKFQFGPNYIIPKPFDPRVLLWVAPAVAKAAIKDGVAQKPITDFEHYQDRLASFQSSGRGFVRNIIHQVKERAQESNRRPKIVFPEGRSEKVLRAVQMLSSEKIIEPILLGNEERIRKKLRELELPLNDVRIIDPGRDENYTLYVNNYYENRKRKGVMWQEAERRLADTNFFAGQMVNHGHADAMISGSTQNYADAVRPILDVIGAKRIASGMNVVMIKNRMLLFADTTVNINPTAEQLASIAIHASRIAGFFKIKPRIAMLSYTNFTSRGENPSKMQQAVKLVKQRYPDMIVDGEMQADTAVNADILDRLFPFSELKDGGANILIFPNLDASNIAYKLVQQLASGEVFGPFLMGLRKPAHVVQRTCTVEDICNTMVLTALQIQILKELNK